MLLFGQKQLRKMSDFVEITEKPEVELNEGFSVICIGSTGTGKSATISKW